MAAKKSITALSDLTQARLKELLHYDPETGLFTWQSAVGSSIKIGDSAGSLHKASGYVRIVIEGMQYRAHRLAWLYMYGMFPPNDLDHKDRSRHNNAISNLRLATKAENTQNVGIVKRANISGLLGTYRKPETGRWRARITVSGRKKNIGTYGTTEEAHAAYLEAKAKYHPFQTLV